MFKEMMRYRHNYCCLCHTIYIYCVDFCQILPWLETHKSLRKDCPESCRDFDNVFYHRALLMFMQMQRRRPKRPSIEHFYHILVKLYCKSLEKALRHQGP